MKGFFRKRTPLFRSTLLIESGERGLYEKILNAIYDTYGSEVRVDLVTCFAGAPANFRLAQGRVFNVVEYGGPAGRNQLLAELLERRYDTMSIICSGESIMTKWKWWLAWKVPAKFFIVNENGDWFWVDYTNWRIIWHFAMFRAGLSGSDAARTIGSVLLFPFGVLYLVLYAAYVHSRRYLRLKRQSHT